MYTRCSLCKEEGHTMQKCPDLTDPLRPGFSGAGGGGGHSHDEEEDSSIHVEGNSVGLCSSDQSSGYTTLSAPPSMAPHQLNELFDMTAPLPQLAIISMARSSSGSSTI